MSSLKAKLSRSGAEPSHVTRKAKVTVREGQPAEVSLPYSGDARWKVQIRPESLGPPAVAHTPTNAAQPDAGGSTSVKFNTDRFDRTRGKYDVTVCLREPNAFPSQTVNLTIHVKRRAPAWSQPTQDWLRATGKEMKACITDSVKEAMETTETQTGGDQ